jgi:small subunit ribosomal protein S8
MDVLANLLTSIRNAQMAQHTTARVPDTKLNRAVLDVLVKSKYLQSVTSAEATFPTLHISFQPTVAIEHIKLISKQGRRIYTDAASIPMVRQGRGIVILSTNQGVMTGKEAHKKNIGGEILCEVY